MKIEIVCIDDEPAALELLAAALEGLGHAIVTIADSSKAVQYIEANHQKILAVISDQKMPGLSGLDLRRKVLPSFPEIPFFLLTGSAQSEMRSEARDLTITDVIEKPFNAQAVEQLIRESCEKRLAAIRELEDLLESFTSDILPLLEKLEDLNSSLAEATDQAVALKSYMGVLHTVKGTAASVGLKKIAEFSHRYEDFVSAFQKGHKPFTNSSLLMISRAFDVLKRDINDVLENGVVHAVDPEFFNRNLSEASDEIEASSATPLQQARGENISLPANSGSSPTVATPATPSTGPHSGAVNNKEEKVFVSLETLNDFISTAANLTTIRSTFGHGIEALRAKYACDKDILSLIVTLNQFAKEISKLQTTAEDLRRVSLVGVFKPMKRMVRELSATLGKDVQFKVNGEDLRVDRSIATLLGNCLVHLFRNCVDHGIEPRDERINKSKPPQGTIHCTITQNDSWVEVEIVDDGKGINPEIVKKKALANSLYSERELNEWPLERILMIIFEPGFSTATTVSDISGRGVGTDMVKRSIEDAGGSIRLTSTVNQGTRFHIRIPIPKSSEVIKVFLVAIHQQVFAVPTTEVVTILKDDIENNRRAVEMMHSKDVLYYDGVYLPVVQAALGSASTVQSNKTILVLQKPNESKRVALSVDSVLVSEEVILKELENFDHFGFSGYFKKVALLGNSRVALLLDVDVTERIHADKSERARDNALERIQGIAC